MGKTRNLFKKIRDTKGTFRTKMGSIKDRNDMDLTEAEEYTEELYKKDLHDPVNHDGVITDLEPDILKREVKWALRSITTNKPTGEDGIPGQSVQSLSSSLFDPMNRRTPGHPVHHQLPELTQTHVH